MSATQRLGELGLTLPAATNAAGSYATSVRSGNLLFLSGHVCRQDGAILSGTAGGDVDTATAQERARSCALELLATLDATVGLDNVRRVVKLTGFVNSAPGFTEQTAVMNGCSDLFVEVLGKDVGTHARSAVGAGGLPMGATVEVEAVVEVA